MYKSITIIAITLLAIFSYTLLDEDGGRKEAVSNTKQWYQHEVTALQSSVDNLCKALATHQSLSQIQTAFKEARLQYKALEVVTAHFNPYTEKFINGPNIPEVEADEKEVVIDAQGFQVLEELIFPALETEDEPQALEQAKQLRANLNRLQMTAEILQATDAQLFDAMRLELLRITSLGISGFDSPIAQHSIPEAAAALKGITTIWHFYVPSLQLINPSLTNYTSTLLEDAQQLLRKEKDFNSFDRLDFTTRYLNRLSVNLKLAREALKIPYDNLPYFLDPAASNAFAKDAYNPAFFAPDQTLQATPAQVALGKQLFQDPILSQDKDRSCATCHQPSKAFTDGQTLPLALHGEKAQMRNTPTILNAALQPFLFYDQRVAYLEDQVHAVVHNKAEMNGSLEKAVTVIQQRPDYPELFNKAFNIEAAKISPREVQSAIAAYVRSQVKLNSPFDAYMRGDTAAIDNAARRGYNLFMGKAKCGTCHFTPLFSGVTPPFFRKADAEIIGVPTAPHTTQIDPDQGKFNLYDIPQQRFAFKTPTLRNIAVTAPYMHNGAFSSLEEVMEFYNNGGGAGMGIAIEGQTLQKDALHLSQQEQQDVISFMRTLTDTTQITH
ncbi:cytochrome C peroxidase [Chitinophaga pendula]|uniref:cytochrome c peroxidase n=1 Tax=Chitinophaga TaxID=79328 RepID=UPI000BB0AF57|nr:MULTISPECIES: cytochrome c peroxidase [Chitinophaga]ASZ10344.1 cytochrome-c peroxidase [Chitinophaga sp. MD30]UCJ06693.1 cytochrome C peroxidase [Chitinophaga pendula]